MRIGRRAAAEKPERLDGPDLVPGSGGNQHRIAGADLAFLAIHFHQSAAFQQIVKLLTQPMIVAFRRATFRQGCLGKALGRDRCVGEVQQAADRRSILGGERVLLFAIADFHAPDKQVRPPAAMQGCPCFFKRQVAKNAKQSLKTT